MSSRQHTLTSTLACDLDLLGSNSYVHIVRRLAIGVSYIIKSQDPSSLGYGDVVRHLLLVLDRVARRREYNIDLLERAILSLDQEEVYDWNEGGIQDGVDDVRLIADVREGRRNGHHDDEAEDLK